MQSTRSDFFWIVFSGLATATAGAVAAAGEPENAVSACGARPRPTAAATV